MTKIKFPKPDYKFWAIKETWSLHQSALLLHGIDPHQHRSVRLTAKELPTEFKEAQKTYFLLGSILWRDRHPIYHFYSAGIHPVAVIYEAKKKKISVPARLSNLVIARYEEEQKQIAEQQEENTQELPLSSRERKNLLKAIGILVKLLIDERGKSTRMNVGTKISSLQISQMMIDKASDLKIEIEGLKSFDRKITEALELLTEEVI